MSEPVRERTGWVRLAVGDLAVAVTTPSEHPVRGSVLLAPPAGFGPAAGRNAVAARIARHLAGLGWSVCRFDYLGCGDSGPGATSFDLASPPSEQVQQLVGALDPPHPRCAIGICFGARVLLAALPELPGFGRLLLVSVPVADVISGEGPPTSLVAGLAAARSSGVGITCCQGSTDTSANQLAAALATVPEPARMQPEICIVDGPLDGFPTAASQDRIVDVVGTWVGARCGLDR